MAIRLTQLTLQGFRSFEQPTTIDFPETGLVLFQGPSGAGKSTVLMGIAYALGYSPYPATELKSWYGDEAMSVRAYLTGTKEGDANIHRGASTSLHTEKGDTKGAAAVNAELPKVLGMDTDLLSALTYRPQKTSGLFLSKTNSEMQDFLTTLLGLHKYEQAIEASGESVKDLVGKFANLVDVQSQLMVEVTTMGMETFPDLEDPRIFQKLVDEAQKLADEQKNALAKCEEGNIDFKARWNNEVKIIKTVGETEYEKLLQLKPVIAPTRNVKIDNLEVLIEQAKARLAKLEAAEVERAALWQAAVDDAKVHVQQAEYAMATLPGLLGQKTELEWNIAELKGETCPRCRQPWIESKSDLVQTQEDLAELEEDIRKARNADLARDGWNSTLADHKKELAKVDPKIAQFKEMIHNLDVERFGETCTLQEKFNTSVKEWEATVTQSKLDIQKRINRINEAHQANYDAMLKISKLIAEDYAKALEGVNEAKKVHRECEVRNAIIAKDRKRHEEALATTKARLEDASEKVKATQDALSIEQDFLELLKTFLTAIFDEVLAEIAWNANQMLMHVPNVAHVTVGFRSESATAKGTIKRAIAPFVNISGVERNPKTALSGGMSTAVELAVDLAVRKVISVRTGVNPGWLVLDECFEGLGIAEKEASMGLLQQAASDTLILVVDHSTEFKEMFSKSFTVTSENGRSIINAD
jgi:DNA repair exonuclease SbcCD ATPase subunit